MIFKDEHGKEYDVDPEGLAITWRISIYGICLNEKGEALLLKSRFNNVWQFPGGGVDIDESLNDALKREFLEEVGYKISTDNKELLFINEQNFYGGNDRYNHSLQLFFKVDLEDENQFEEFIETGEDMDYGEVEWLNINMLEEKDIQHTHLPVVALLKNKILAKPE